MAVKEKEIAQQLTELINSRLCIEKTNDNKWKTHYREVIDELEMEIKVSKSCVKDYKKSGLSINQVEQEGYLRCLITMVNRFKEWEEYLSDKNNL